MNGAKSGAELPLHLRAIVAKIHLIISQLDRLMSTSFLLAIALNYSGIFLIHG